MVWLVASQRARLEVELLLGPWLLLLPLELLLELPLELLQLLPSVATPGLTAASEATLGAAGHLRSH